MTIMLNDVRCLLYLLIQGHLLVHKGILTNNDGVEMMMEYIVSTDNEAESTVKRTKGEHAQFVYLMDLIKRHLQNVKKAKDKGDVPIFERYKDTS
jgi:superfamily I DNA and RNA helicase